MNVVVIIERFIVTNVFVLKFIRQSDQILQMITLFITRFGSDIRVNKMTAHT